MNNGLRRISLLFFIILFAASIKLLFFTSFGNDINISYDVFKSNIDRGNIFSAFIYENGNIYGRFKMPVNNNLEYRTRVIKLTQVQADEYYNEIIAKNPEAQVNIIPETSSGWLSLLSWLPIIVILFFFWIFIARQQMQGGGLSGPIAFAKSRARLMPRNKKVTFADVAGINEAKEELQEIVEFLREPAKFKKLGGKIPKGVLLVGPPGTGKTLLARAVAGEADAPFFSISGSSFVEMFVGVGASRVRDFFAQGQKNAPCILFIDEIDAVGRQRGAGVGGGHDEREQTLNQLLVEMDGFESHDGVILIAATNRPDVLDPALLRPGRFDRRVVVSRPDVTGRKGILAVHTKDIPIAEDIDLGIIARGTAGFTGADLANLVNEAALNAARYKRTAVTLQDFEFAKDKVLMGSEKRSMVISDEEKSITAIHEAGHALLAAILPNAEPLHKVTIIPRGMALGLTQQLPMDDKHNYSKPYLEDQLAILLGGRIAEEILNNGIQTTGASNDLERVTDMARRMVCEWGMSDLGPMTFGKNEKHVFLGREIAQHQDYSQDTGIKIDGEIKKIIMAAHEKAKSLLVEKMDILSKISVALLIREVLTGEQVKKIIAGKELDEVRDESQPLSNKTINPRT